MHNCGRRYIQMKHVQFHHARFHRTRVLLPRHSAVTRPASLALIRSLLRLASSERRSASREPRRVKLTRGVRGGPHARNLVDVGKVFPDAGKLALQRS